MNTNETLQTIREIIRKIDTLDKNIDTELTGLTPQEAFIKTELAAVIEHLCDAANEYHAFLSDETCIYKEGSLEYSPETARFHVCDKELHCGDSVEVCVRQGGPDGILRWIPTNIEMSDRWYLIGVGRGYGINCEQDLIGLPARLRTVV